MENLNMPTEILDLEEARRRLPEVRRHVEKIMGITREVRALQERAEGYDSEQEAIRTRVATLEERFRRSLKAMNDLGAYLKDPEIGLLDFYTWMDGEMVFLCWRYGEDDIRFWHPLDSGYSGRQPLL